MKIIDLSHPITTNMPTYPNDAPTIIKTTATHTRQGYHLSEISFSPHNGTHIDGPKHMIDTPELINETDLQTFIGRAWVFDVRGQTTIETLPHSDRIQQGDMVILYTHHDQWFNKHHYYTNYPTVSERLAQFFVSKKIKLLGIDTPSPDTEPYPIHKALLAKGIYIVENLTNLHKLPKDQPFVFSALPLALHAEASPVRAIAFIEIPQCFIDNFTKKNGTMK